ncbi:MAG: SPW repeat protein [Geminicoccaceae bacterium]
MPKASMMSVRWRDWITLALAACLFVSPWLQSYVGAKDPAWNAWIIGAAVGAVSIWAIVRFAGWHDWANGILGLWLVVTPWVLGYGQMTSIVWTHVILGLLIIAAAAWELWDEWHPGSKAAA